MRVSVIIPALNEENYLPKLLESIKRQDVEDLEVIVADAGSEDRTRDIAEGYGYRVVQGGLPAKGRNEGAKVAQGDIFVFLDADVILPEHFFEKALAEFQKRELVVASVLLQLPKRNHQLRMDILYNFPILLLEKVLPHAAMFIMVKRKIYERVGGFDESVRIAEDVYFVRQAAKHGRFGLLRSARILTSPRRYLRDRASITYLKFLLVELHMIFLGPVRSDIFKYRFDHYHK